MTSGGNNRREPPLSGERENNLPDAVSIRMPTQRLRVAASMHFGWSFKAATPLRPIIETYVDSFLMVMIYKKESLRRLQKRGPYSSFKGFSG